MEQISPQRSLITLAPDFLATNGYKIVIEWAYEKVVDHKYNCKYVEHAPCLENEAKELKAPKIALIRYYLVYYT